MPLQRVSFVILALCLGAASSSALAQQASASAKKPAAKAPGMTVTGEREAPLALFISPWRESEAAPPPALRQSGLPPVFEYDRSLSQDPLNRSVAVLHTARQEATDEADRLEAKRLEDAKKVRRRSRDKDE